MIELLLVESVWCPNSWYCRVKQQEEVFVGNIKASIYIDGDKLQTNTEDGTERFPSIKDNYIEFALSNFRRKKLPQYIPLS